MVQARFTDSILNFPPFCLDTSNKGHSTLQSSLFGKLIICIDILVQATIISHLAHWILAGLLLSFLFYPDLYDLFFIPKQMNFKKCNQDKLFSGLKSSHHALNLNPNSYYGLKAQWPGSLPKSPAPPFLKHSALTTWVILLFPFHDICTLLPEPAELFPCTCVWHIPSFSPIIAHLLSPPITLTKIGPPRSLINTWPALFFFIVLLLLHIIIFIFNYN